MREATGCGVQPSWPPEPASCAADVSAIDVGRPEVHVTPILRGVEAEHTTSKPFVNGRTVAQRGAAAAAALPVGV